MPITITGATLSGVTFNPTAVSTDPYFMYVPLLLNTTSTNGQQNNTFLDSSSNAFTITRNGTPTQGAFTPYQPSGYWSGYFDGATAYLSLASNAAFGFGTNDFTVEFWIYPLVAANTWSIYHGAVTNAFIINTNASNQVVARSYGVADLLTSSSAISTNSWTHVAITRSGTTLTIWLNGVSAGTVSNSTNFATTALYVGRADSGSTYVNGYISNLRTVKGTAVYTSTFTPPTTPLTAITNTSLLTLQSNRFIDNSTNNFAITVNGTPKVQAFQPFAPAASYSAATYGGSGYFNGTTDSLSAPNNTVFDFGSGDFTLELWYFPTAQGQSGYSGLLGKFVDASNYAPFYIVQRPSSYNVGFFSSSTNSSWNLSPTTSNFGTMQANAWNHIAISRQGVNCRCFLNGVTGQTSNFSTTALMTNSSPVYIGSGNVATTYSTGYISNVRIVKGTALYTGDFTPPTAPVTAVSGTSLLTNFTNAGIYDAAWQNNALTVGDAQVSTTQYQFSPTSMKFDGTGDYLTMPINAGTTITSGDFTVEFWLYPSTVATATQAIIGTTEGDTAGTINWMTYLVSSSLYFQCYSNSSTLMVQFNHQTSL
jgi:hypothetical protein